MPRTEEAATTTRGRRRRVAFRHVRGGYLSAGASRGASMCPVNAEERAARAGRGAKPKACPSCGTRYPADALFLFARRRTADHFAERNRRGFGKPTRISGVRFSTTSRFGSSSGSARWAASTAPFNTASTATWPSRFLAGSRPTPRSWPASTRASRSPRAFRSRTWSTCSSWGSSRTARCLHRRRYLDQRVAAERPRRGGRTDAPSACTSHRAATHRGGWEAHARNRPPRLEARERDARAPRGRSRFRQSPGFRDRALELG